MSEGNNEKNSILKCKIPSISACLVVILLLFLLLIFSAVIVTKIRGLTDPLHPDIARQEHIVYSKYTDWSIVESGSTYIIYVDNRTDNLYIELKSNEYSSALSPLLDKNGLPMKLSDY